MKRLLVVMCLATLVACSSAPETGTVIDKKFEPAHWESGYRTEYRPEFKCHTRSVYNAFSKQYEMKQDCGTEMVPHQVYESHHHYEQDAWSLKLERCKVDRKDCKRGWRRVSEHDYREHRVGSFYGGDDG